MTQPSHPLRRRLTQRSGFTLIELILVMGIIALLAGLAIYQLRGVTDIAKEQRVAGDLGSVANALQLYEISNFRLPTTDQGLDALVKKPDTGPEPKSWKQHFKIVPLDPWGNPYQYRYPGKKNTGSYDLYSLGPDGKESGDDIGNWES